MKIVLTIVATAATLAAKPALAQDASPFAGGHIASRQAGSAWR